MRIRPGGARELIMSRLHLIQLLQLACTRPTVALSPLGVHTLLGPLPKLVVDAPRRTTLMRQGNEATGAECYHCIGNSKHNYGL